MIKRLWKAEYIEAGGMKSFIYFTTDSDDISVAIIVFREIESVDERSPLLSMTYLGTVYIKTT